MQTSTARRPRVHKGRRTRPNPRESQGRDAEVGSLGLRWAPVYCRSSLKEQEQ